MYVDTAGIERAKKQMLAQSFMTAEQLEIEPDVRDGLIDLLGRMERGEIEQAPYNGDFGYDRCYDFDLTNSKFHMAHWNTKYTCGTIRCMGGYLEGIIMRPLGRKVERQLSALFFPSLLSINYRRWDDLTVEICATTLRNYLTTGEIDWSHVKNENAK